MAYRDVRHDSHHLVSNGLHPAIYAGLAGLSLWLVVSAWIFFGSEGHYAAYSVAIATGFFAMAGAIPFVIWQTWRHNAPDGAPDQQPDTAFSDWWRGEVETWQGRVEGWDAAVEVLLPLGAAAIGMTLIGLIFRLTAG
jgi:hypothetical protein